MAASQARLLTLTARIHDVEYQAQSIQNAKVQLSTQQDQVYEDYQKALDATTLTFTAIDPQSGTQSTLTANFNNLFSVNKATAAGNSDYALFDSKGKVVVDENLYHGYKMFKDLELDNESPYTFAMYMICGDAIDFEDSNIIQGEADGIYQNYCTTDEKLSELYDAIMDILIEYGGDDYIPDDINDTNCIAGLDDEEYNNVMAQYNEAMNNYLYYIYSNNAYASEMYANITGEAPEDFNSDMFNYYVKMFNVIEQSGGCISIESFNGINNNDAKNDSEWLTNMIQSGIMTIEVINQDKNTGKVTLSGTSPASNESLQYTTTTQIDKAALAKAEAKYEHDLKLIDKKDKQFDLDLSKLETERTALTTQYDSVKKVIEDNIDRTFGIFS